MTRRDFEPILKKYSRSGLKLKPYLKTSITQIVNAKSVYAKGVDSTTIVALFDTTFLKNGKTGYLLTLDGLYSSQFGGKVIRFDSVKAVDCVSGKLQVTYKNGKKTDFSAETYAPDLCALIRDVLALRGVDATPAKKPVETKESIKQKKAAIQKEMAKLEAEMAALEEETAAAKEEKPTNPEPQQTQAEMGRQKAAENREAQRNQEQDEFDRMLAELDTFFDEPAAEETPAQEVKTAPASVQEEAPRKTELETVLQGMGKANQQLMSLLAAKKTVPSKPNPVPAETPVLWKRMDADTEWNFEQAVRNIMIGTPEGAAEWAKKVQAAGHPMAEQLRWLLAGELDRHSGQVHPFFLALDAYGKKRYAQAVAQFEVLAQQGCEDAIVALGYDAVYEMNGPVDLERAFACRERVTRDKGGVLATIAVNIDTQRRLEKLDAEHADLFRTESYTAEGAAAYKKGDYALAIQVWEEGWRHGEDTAAYNLSYLYDSGKVPKNAQLLCLWSRRFADMTTDKENLLKTAQRLYRNKDTAEVLLTCADCALKLAKMGDSTMMGVFEQLMNRSKTAEDFEVCLKYAKRLIKAGRFEGVRMLTSATWRLEDALEKLHPRTNGADRMEHVEIMETFKPGKVKKIIPILENCVEAKVGGAAFTLFQIYSLGIGVAADRQKARYWANKVQVGDDILFGYEKRYPMGWTVLAREDNRLLLLSNDMLALHAYDPKGNVTWENCELRRWMNSKLLDKLFTKEEQKLIATVRNKNPGDPMYLIPNGNDTMDRLFLLSAEEVKRYFTTYKTGSPLDLTVVTDSRTRMGVPSDLLRVSYTDVSTFSFSKDEIHPWLLRTPGADLRKQTSISSTRYINYRDANVRNEIRPALWIDLNV